MPVTPAHALAAWPIRRLVPALPLSALIIGALSPDYEYFLRLAPVTRAGHRPEGLIFFCIPVSMTLWVVFRRIVRPAIVELLPPGLGRALGPASRSWSLAFLAVILGAISHIVWDGFTHQGDWGVRLLPALKIRPFPHVLPLPWFRLLQHGSSTVGLVLLMVWAASWIFAQPPSARRFAPGQFHRAARVVSIILLVSAACAVANGWVAARHLWAFDLGRAAVGAMAGCAASVLLYALWRTAATVQRASP